MRRHHFTDKQVSEQNVQQDLLSDAPVSVAVCQAARKLCERASSSGTSQAFPWRRLRTPYRVFLAEFLLVRTRSDVVARVFEDVVSRYPSVESLAATNESALATVLEPLGMRKRVPLLLRAARYLKEHYDGSIPNTIPELMAVPGLGRYSAVAIAAFAYQISDVPADVNILRFISRLTGLPMTHPTKGSRELWALLPLLAHDRGGPMPEDLLDFSRVICRPRHPQCELCPLQQQCVYRSENSGPATV